MESPKESGVLLDQPFAGFKHRFAPLEKRLVQKAYDDESLNISTLYTQKKPPFPHNSNSVVDTIPVGTYQTPLASSRASMRM